MGDPSSSSQPSPEKKPFRPAGQEKVAPQTVRIHSESGPRPIAEKTAAPAVRSLEEPAPAAPPISFSQTSLLPPSLAMPVGEFRSASAWAHATLVLLTISLAVPVVLAIIQFQILDMVRLQQNNEKVELPLLLRLAGLIGLGIILLEFVLSIVFLCWFYQAYRNLRSLGARRVRFSPGWTVVIWLIPLINLVLGYLATTDLWDAGASPGASPQAVRDARTPIRFWWGISLLGGIVGFVTNYMSAVALQAGEIWIVGPMIVLQTVFYLASILLAIVVVEGIDRRHEQRHREVRRFLAKTNLKPIMPSPIDEQGQVRHAAIRSVVTWGWLAIILLIPILIIALHNAMGWFGELPKSWTATHFFSDHSAARRVTSHYRTVLSPALLVAGAVFLPFFLGWVYRAYNNLRILQAGCVRYTPGWTVVCWLVPIVNQFLPYLVMTDIWNGSDPAASRPGRPAIGRAAVAFWWLLCLSLAFLILLQLVGFVVPVKISTGLMTIEPLLIVFYYLLTVVVPALTLVLIGLAGHWQKKRFKRQFTKFQVDQKDSSPVVMAELVTDD